jgi:hypothetical protein
VGQARLLLSKPGFAAFGDRLDYRDDGTAMTKRALPISLHDMMREGRV